MFANTIFAARSVIAICALLMGVFGSQAVFANSSEVVALAPGQQHIIAFTQKLEKVAVSNPEVASVQASGEKEVLVTAKGTGTVTVRVWLKGKSSPSTTEYLVSSTAGERHPVPMQVQTDIRVVEVSRQQLNTLGFHYAKLFNGGDNAFGISPNGGSFTSPGGVPGSAAGIGADGFNLFSFGSNHLSIINALESGGFAYTLAEPSLVSLSGQNATFLSGGEFPVPISGSDGEVQIEYKEFGVSLSLTPTVVDENQIILKVAPEVSDLDFTSGVTTTGGVSVPGLRVRRTETMVSMAPGESFVISGLVSRSTFNNSDKLPGLGNIPILGALFRSDRISSDDRELIMVVTPRFVSATKELPEEVKSFGKKYEYSSTEWGDMLINSRDGTEPLESGLSW
ncbi:MAG: pilus assembly protein N-terminal domain-containing protein [Marinobacter sp.]|uniref:type II and III secretion system protein family protein n=3 Tax=Marinobacter sp. TaxID=50741 RepID=UPI002B27A881|nr:pilus assembly protein N-terminal domain-containing protein [Marinobacter sp.]